MRLIQAIHQKIVNLKQYFMILIAQMKKTSIIKCFHNHLKVQCMRISMIYLIQFVIYLLQQDSQLFHIFSHQVFERIQYINMPQFKGRSINQKSKILLKFAHNNNCLPFAEYLKSKNIQGLFYNTRRSSSPKILPIKRKKPSRDNGSFRLCQRQGEKIFVEIGNQKSNFSSQKLFHRLENKQWQTPEKSSKILKTCQSLKKSFIDGIQERRTIGNLPSFYKTCNYSIYDVINASKTYNLEKDSFMMKSKRGKHSNIVQAIPFRKSQDDSIKKTKKDEIKFSLHQASQRTPSEIMSVFSLFNTTSKLF